MTPKSQWFIKTKDYLSFLLNVSYRLAVTAPVAASCSDRREAPESWTYYPHDRVKARKLIKTPDGSWNIS